MGKTILLVMSLVLLIAGSVNALTVESGVEIMPSGSNTTYELNTTISLNTFDVESNAPYFNGHVFQIEPYSGVATVTINSWDPPTMEFEVTTTDETSMVLGGFTPTTRYGIYVDGAYWTDVTITASGTAVFTYPHFSTHTFSFGSLPQNPSGGKRPSRPTIPAEEPRIPEMPEPGRVDTLIWVILGAVVIVLIVVLSIEIKKGFY